ncbi:WD40-repeat-containing domain protein [Cyathus striatus]|nr:WD40-repeat-containing domain protein [Cyathus striatus]
MDQLTLLQREQLAYRLLASLPRSRLASVHRSISPLLQFDILGSLPSELSLQILSHLPAPTLLTCSQVSKRWHALSNDPALWKVLCDDQGWKWRHPRPERLLEFLSEKPYMDDDEGMGDSDSEDSGETEMFTGGLDSGFASMTISDAPLGVPARAPRRLRHPVSNRHSAPSTLASMHPPTPLQPSYKLLHQTHTRLRARFLGEPETGHTSTIYCLQLYTYPTGNQVLFTGSRDKSIREWNLSDLTSSSSSSFRKVERVFNGHASSVLSICACDGWLVSAGSDRRVVLWELDGGSVRGVVCDHEDSVLCVRVDMARGLLVSCSKDRTVRVYTFPALTPKFVLREHRAAVNAVSIHSGLIVSGSGDRSVRLWDAETGELLRTFENHHTRGIASIDFYPPYILSGSSDKHLRLFDMTTLMGWGTAPADSSRAGGLPFPFPSSSHPLTNPSSASAESSNSSANLNMGVGRVCNACGQICASAAGRGGGECAHNDLVRSVALGEEWVVSGSYDLSIKVWSRRTGALVTTLTGGHTGRIFCVDFDNAKIVSCGEDQRVCVWDFGYGVDTSFVWL